MKYINIISLFSKIERISSKLKNINGEGTSWSYISENGIKTKYTIKKIRDLESIQDDVENCFIWLWSLKDYLKSIVKDKQEVEDIINNSNNLKISGDIANLLKHSNLNKSRSRLFPKLGKLKVTISGKNISKITFRGNEFEFLPVDINKAQMYLSIYDKDNKEMMDAFELLRNVEYEWEMVCKKFNIPI